jgi:predicted transposase/invertase (TIGR01784 family)
MAQVQYPHDRFCKEVMGQPDIAAEFLSLYLPAQLVALANFNDITPVKGSFVTVELQEYFSDLLFRVRLRTGAEIYVYILLEHKSDPDKWVAFQLFSYLPPLLEKIRGKSKNLPLILPVVFYHGNRPWNIADNLGALFETPGELAAFRPYLPELRYYLCDLARYRDEDLTGRPHLQAILRVFKHAQQDDLNQQLAPIFALFKESNLPPARIFDLLKVSVVYLTHGTKANPKELEEAFTMNWGEYSTDPSELTGTFLDKWILAGLEKGEKEGLQKGRQEGLQKGRQEGEQEGRQKGAATVALKLAQRRFSTLSEEAEEQIMALSVSDAEDLGLALLDLQSLPELTAWLQAHQPRERLN